MMRNFKIYFRKKKESYTGYFMNFRYSGSTQHVISSLLNRVFKSTKYEKGL